MLDDDQDLYGQGMWAPSLRWHNGRFHVLFSANDTHTTHLFTAEDARGPWRHHIVQGFYHDPSLLFDDGRVFIVHGNTALRLTEMEVDLSGPKAGGLDRVLVQDLPNQDLGYEGSHLQRHDGRYYLFTCHFARDHRKTEDCFIADSLDGEFRGRCILDDDLDTMTKVWRKVAWWTRPMANGTRSCSRTAGHWAGHPCSCRCISIRTACPYWA